MPHVFVPDVPLTQRQAYSIGEASALAGLSPSYVYLLMKRGLLRTVKIGGRRLVPREALDDMLGRRAAQRQQPEPAAEPTPPPSRHRGQRKTRATESVEVTT
jgi:excisionase family DNA binding protein